MGELQEDYEGKCRIARKNRLTEKDGSITKHTGGSIPVGAHRQKMEKVLGREVTDLELFQRCHRKNKGSGEFIDNKSKRISEEYLAKMGCTDVSSQSSFDLSTWYDVIGGPSKGRLYGFGSNLSSTSASSVSSSIKASKKKLNKLTKAVEDMRSNTTKMEEEFSRREEENRKLLETALEEARKREADLQELVRKLLQDVGYTNHQFAGGSGQQEQQHSKENR
ncbi:UNVERIFIED_CONTAM: hypothetical protein Slati_3883700 [Sesamum latifolium]|uniref:Uncharacterized protein n=1 Tax=Sesamum latifolium TaxID=2727402 RepID=A0AAW2TMG9_9LAMI